MGAPAFLGDPRHFNDKGPTGNSSFKTVPHDFDLLMTAKALGVTFGD